MTVTLRPEAPSDLPFLRRLVLATVAAKLGASQWPEPLRSQVLEMQCNAQLQSIRAGYPNGESSIVVLDGADAGWLYVARLEHELHLVEIMLLPEMQGKGAGTEVLRGLLASAGELPVRLSVDRMNPGAARLYERLGFRRIGGDEVQDLLEYRTPAC